MDEGGLRPDAEGAETEAQPARGIPDPAQPAVRPISKRRIALIVAGVIAAIIAAIMIQQMITWPDVKSLATSHPESTAFIDRYRERMREQGQDDGVAWRWVSYDQISQQLKAAIVVSEDIEFFDHGGFSTSEIRAAIREAFEDGDLRGASTITQQLAKNLWLSPSRNPLRKLKEALLTYQLEKHLAKERIYEVYLNVVEFGAGIYGAHAAARHYFGKPASDLTRDEAVQLAASLPNPRAWHPGSERSGFHNRISIITQRMQSYPDFLARHFGTGVVFTTPITEASAIPDSLNLLIPDTLLLDTAAIDTIADPVADTTVVDTVAR
jgi:monofunctional biosynthetic peptidoglycan transglycosylase